MKVYAHRGASGLYPENTMLAFRKALEAGSDGIELDVHLSADKEVVIIHDETLERTTDGSGRVCDKSLAELRTLNAAHFWQTGEHYEAIPTFEEYCAWVATTDLVTNIEIKSGIIYYPELEAKILKIVAAHRLEERIIISSFNHLSLIAVKRINPAIRCAALTFGVGLENAGYCSQAFDLEFYHPQFTAIDAQRIAECHNHGVKVNVWTVDSMRELQQCFAWGCDGVITNFPEVCRTYIDAQLSK
jgi:glycerophosphoryl diester phosphodiesterase